jgi:hypothetical protein
LFVIFYFTQTVDYNLSLSDKFFNDKLCKEIHNGIEIIAYDNRDLPKNTWLGKNNDDYSLILIKLKEKKK